MLIRDRSWQHSRDKASFPYTHVRFRHWDIEKNGHLTSGALALALGQQVAGWSVLFASLQISFVSTSEKLDPSSFSALWKLELGYLFCHFSHVACLAERRCCPHGCRYIFSCSHVRSARRGSAHRASHGNVELVKALWKFVEVWGRHHGPSPCGSLCVCTHGIRTENDKRKCLHSIYIFSCLANNEAECPGVASTLLPWWIAKDQFWALSEPWGLIFRSKVWLSAYGFKVGRSAGC